MIKYHWELEQSTDAWFAARCGILTASEMKNIITPAKLEYAKNDKERSHLYEIAAQRVNNCVEPTYQSDEMYRGKADEYEIRELYSKHYSPVKECGFITNDEWGFTLGFSPDGLVGDDGFIEGKSRRQKFQFETIVNAKMPEEFLIQVQTGLLVTRREWCDFISYCGGMRMFSLRVYPDAKVCEAIINAATTFHAKLDELLVRYTDRLEDKTCRLIPTVRRPQEGEIRV